MSGRPRTSTGGAAAGPASGTIYSYQIPQGGYAPNGNLLAHTDSVMGTWNFSYDAVEFAAMEACAHQTDMTLSEWVRAVLLAAPGAELLDDEAALAGRVTLAEVLALRTLFLILQFRQAQGPMTEAEMRGLIERADAVMQSPIRLFLAHGRDTSNLYASEQRAFGSTAGGWLHRRWLAPPQVVGRTAGAKNGKSRPATGQLLPQGE